jgi:hypothetical protein
MSRKIWKCNNTTCGKYHRIDFDTETITLDSRYERFYSSSENIQPDDWYTDAPHGDQQTSSTVRDNINTLSSFINEHIGDNSGDYENLKSSITQLHTNDGKKVKKRKSKSRKSRKRKRSKRKI